MRKRILSLLLALVLVLGLMPVTAMAASESNTLNIKMRLGKWHDINLSNYFTGSSLKYYIKEHGSDKWTELQHVTENNTYAYYPADDGMQNVVFAAVASDQTENDINESTPKLYLNADVEEVPDEVTLTVSITASTDRFHEEGGYTLISREVTIPYFSLAKYGLSDYYFNPRCYVGKEPNSIGGGQPGDENSAKGVVTPLHAFIWLTEVFKLDENEERACTDQVEAGDISDYLMMQDGSCAGSAYIDFWGQTNFNYYVNMEFPLGAPKTGATCDQLALYNGDQINIHMIVDDGVYGASFAALVEDNDNQYDFGVDATEKTVNKGEPVTLTLYHSEPDYINYSTLYHPTPGAEIRYIEDHALVADLNDWHVPAWNGEGVDYCTNDNGQIEINTSAMNGTYYIAAFGGIDETGNGTEREATLFKLTVVGDKPEAPQPPAVTVDTSKLGNLLPKENITIADGTMTIAPADNTPACMVLVKNGDQYTRVAATKNADNTYNFNVSNLPEGASIVVAAKADLDGNGTIDAPETVQIKAAQLGNLTTFSNLQNMVADLDGNGEIDAAETVQIKAAQLGNFVLGW